jgi:ABC-2 type transport system ATP-binding protein
VSATDIAIETIDLRKAFKETQVLKGVDLTVRRGEIFALLGSNGAGKTTTINILATLLVPDAGAARVCGFDTQQESDRVRERISLTGQFSAVDGMLTGRENLVLVAKLREAPEPTRIADRLLQQFGLHDAANKRVDTYSGGMTRRLDIAMSLVGSPAVIFLDEPTTGLDPEGRREVWKTIKELAGSGTTILLTTQHLDEAEHLADRIAILHGGCIIANGTLAELKRLLPPATVEYVEKQPTLEEIFLAVVGTKTEEVQS